MRGLTAAIGFTVTALMPIAPAAADPAPPTEPAPPAPAEFIPQQSSIRNPLAQSGDQPTGPLGLPDLSALGPNILLGQTVAPAGSPPGTVVPSLNPYNLQYLLGQNVIPAAPGEGTPAPGLAPDQDIPGTGRIAFLRRIYGMYQAGDLKGSLLGQQSPEEFAQQAAEDFAERTQAISTPTAAPAPTTTTLPPPPPG